MHTYMTNAQGDLVIAVRGATAKQLRALNFNVIGSSAKLRRARKLGVTVRTMRLVDGRLVGI